MLIGILTSDGYSFREKLILIFFLPLVVLISLVLHECAHALASYALGDPTAKRAGRLTLNPFKHLSLIGTLCMLFCGFGWANPVPVDPRYYKNPKKGMALTALAGPVTNLYIGVSALVWYSALVFLYVTGIVYRIPLLGTIPDNGFMLIFELLGIVYYYNLLLAVFNMMPVPPLDGSRLMLAFLPAKKYFAIMKYERIIMAVMLVVLWTGSLSFVFEGIVSVIEKAVCQTVWLVMELITGINSL